MGKQETDDVMRKVKDWLTDEGIYKDKVPDDNANYHFIVEYPQNSGRITEIIQPKQRDDLILIASGTELSKEHYDGLKTKRKEERDKILWDIRFDLLFRNTDFKTTPEEEFQKIEFFRSLYFDGLTKIMLMDAIRENYKCYLYIVWKMRRLFGESPLQSQETMYG